MVATAKEKTKTKKRRFGKVGRPKGRNRIPEGSWHEDEASNLETLEFICAIDRFKRRTLKVYPTWSEVLVILKSLGYEKVAC